MGRSRTPKTSAPEMPTPWLLRPPTVKEIAAHARAHQPGLWLILSLGHTGPEILRLYVRDGIPWCGRNAAGTEHLAPLGDYAMSGVRWLPLDGRGVPLAALLPETVPQKQRRLHASGDMKRTCSFCGKPPGEGQIIIAGPEVFICPECVGLCADILAERHEEMAAPATSEYVPALGSCYDGLTASERKTAVRCLPCAENRSHQCTNLLYRLILAGSSQDRSLVHGPAPLAYVWSEIPAPMLTHVGSDLDDMIRAAEAQGREDLVIARRELGPEGAWPLVIQRPSGDVLYRETRATAPTSMDITAADTARLADTIAHGLTPGHVLRQVFHAFGPLGRSGLLYVHLRTRIPILFLVEEIGLLAAGYTSLKGVQNTAEKTLANIGWQK